MAIGPYKWKVDPEPTGPYRSFNKRGWPTAETLDGESIAHIRCKDEYRPANLPTANHAPLHVYIRCKNVNPEKNGAWSWRKLKGEFKTLVDAKFAVERFFRAHPEHEI